MFIFFLIMIINPLYALHLFDMIIYFKSLLQIFEDVILFCEHWKVINLLIIV
jgi:hypothetical protein